MEHCWDRFLIEGDILFNYMIHNFENIFDGDLIKYFNICNGIYNLNDEPIEIKDKYSNDLQKELIIWINTR